MGAVRTGGVGEVRIAAYVDVGGTRAPTAEEPVHRTDDGGCARHQAVEPVRSTHVSGHHLYRAPEHGLGVCRVTDEDTDLLARPR